MAKSKKTTKVDLSNVELTASSDVGQTTAIVIGEEAYVRYGVYKDEQDKVIEELQERNSMLSVEVEELRERVKQLTQQLLNKQ